MTAIKKEVFLKDNSKLCISGDGLSVPHIDVKAVIAEQLLGEIKSNLRLNCNHLSIKVLVSRQ